MSASVWQSKIEGSSVLGAFSASKVFFARDEPSSKRVGGVGLSYLLPSWREPPKLQQA